MPPEAAATKAAGTAPKAGGGGGGSKGGKGSGAPAAKAAKAPAWVLPRSVPQPEHNHTLSHLLQVANYFSFLASLYRAAPSNPSAPSTTTGQPSAPSRADIEAERQRRRKETLQSLSSRYTRDTLSLSRKAVLRLDVGVKRGLCRCGMARMGGGWKAKRNGPHGKVLVQRCPCGGRKRWPASRAWPDTALPVLTAATTVEQGAAQGVSGAGRVDSGKGTQKEAASEVMAMAGPSQSAVAAAVAPGGQPAKRKAPPSAIDQPASKKAKSSKPPKVRQLRLDVVTTDAGHKELGASAADPVGDQRKKSALRRAAEAPIQPRRSLSQRQRRKQSKLRDRELRNLARLEEKMDEWVERRVERENLGFPRRVRMDPGSLQELRTRRQMRIEAHARPKGKSRKERKVERAARIAQRDARRAAAAQKAKQAQPPPIVCKAEPSDAGTDAVATSSAPSAAPRRPNVVRYADRIEGSGWDRPIVALEEAAARAHEQPPAQASTVSQPAPAAPPRQQQQQPPQGQDGAVDEDARYAVHAAHYYGAATRMRGNHVVVHGVGKGGLLGPNQ
ncbi:uncharacterized protein PFL1_04805 [Pseudozyma flocculosa PF-1]|uniref:Uncharacterized protein n=1 Tax=Pseudozyma flocculosa PF-1 TaxID=1277687 RepID=A0A061H476_9BASI|nr:uncharacterized protein PFL1_04805 [Pseudozyma flocculosa PF-1]EPQ27667.1 hypothetical protein PFL1_04805 [Pseudozyma flocculosa PF-1]